MSQKHKFFDVVKDNILFSAHAQERFMTRFGEFVLHQSQFVVPAIKHLMQQSTVHLTTEQYENRTRLIKRYRFNSHVGDGTIIVAIEPPYEIVKTVLGKPWSIDKVRIHKSKKLKKVLDV